MKGGGILYNVLEYFGYISIVLILKWQVLGHDTHTSGACSIFEFLALG